MSRPYVVRLSTRDINLSHVVMINRLRKGIGKEKGAMILILDEKELPKTDIIQVIVSENPYHILLESQLDRELFLEAWDWFCYDTQAGWSDLYSARTERA